MSALVEALVVEINKQLVENGAAIGDACLCVQLGEEHDNEEGAPPRIVMFPDTDSFEPINRAGGNPRAILTCLENFEVRIWGRDFTECEYMRDQFILALHMKVFGAYTIGSGKWDRTTLLSQYGRKYVLKGVQLKTPVTDQKNAYAPAGTKFEVSVVTELPSGPAGKVVVKIPLVNTP